MDGCGLDVDVDGWDGQEGRVRLPKHTRRRRGGTGYVRKARRRPPLRPRDPSWGSMRGRTAGKGGERVDPSSAEEDFDRG